MIQEGGLDQKNGFDLKVELIDDQVKRGMLSGEVALLEERVDFIDTDWISIARYRNQGKRLVGVFPYGRIMGGIVVHNDSELNILERLQTYRLGVVNRTDKNLSVLRIIYQQRYGLDLFDCVEIIETYSKTELMLQLINREVDAAILYWHQVPFVCSEFKFRQLVDILDLLPELNFQEYPTTFFTFREDFVAENSGTVGAFINAFREAVTLLKEDADLWERIVFDLIGNKTVVFSKALRKSWLRRMTYAWNEEALQRLNLLYNRIGDKKTGGIDKLPEGTLDKTWMLPETKIERL
jgi:NitT/TauT family transport system substrate-binding protein